MLSAMSCDDGAGGSNEKDPDGGGSPETEGGDDSEVGEWAALPGGAYAMGDSSSGYTDEVPVHMVTLAPFEMMRSEVTAAMFARCVADGGCSTESYGTTAGRAACNIDVSERQEHPMNCVQWDGAMAYCEWVGGRLPSEAEWEYAARSGGKEQQYPWGDESATCERAVKRENDQDGCGLLTTWPVCSKDSGNTQQGLCDMAGNVAEWVEDYRNDTYDGAPTDGGPWLVDGTGEGLRVVRGGAFTNSSPNWARASFRYAASPGSWEPAYGFRCVRSLEP